MPSIELVACSIRTRCRETPRRKWYMNGRCADAKLLCQPCDRLDFVFAKMFSSTTSVEYSKIGSDQGTATIFYQQKGLITVIATQTDTWS